MTAVLKCLIGGLILSVLFLPLPSAVTAADWPDCPPGAADHLRGAVFEDVPDRIPAGQVRQGTVNPLTYWADVTVSLTPATERPIAHPFNRTGSALMLGDAGRVIVPILVESSDGPALLSVIFPWTASNGGPGCRATVSKTVTAIPTERVDEGPVKVFIQHRRRQDGLIWEVLLAERVPVDLRVEAWSPGRGKLSLDSDGDVPISWDNEGWERNNHFSLHGSERLRNARVRVRFASLVRSTKRYAVFYKIKIGEKVVRRGSFRVSTRVRRGKGGREVPYKVRNRVWRGTDAFFNYCIKGGRELFSKDGRLYCWKSSTRYRIVGYKPDRVRVRIDRLR